MDEVFDVVRPQWLEECPVNWLEYNSHCYFFDYNTSVNWSEARSQCGLDVDGADLVVMETEGELMFINGIISPPYPLSYLWIGLTGNYNSDGRFYWVTGLELPDNVSYWEFGQPNNYFGMEHCVDLLAGDYKAHGVWRDIWCGTRQGYICEKKREPSNSTTLALITAESSHDVNTYLTPRFRDSTILAPLFTESLSMTQQTIESTFMTPGYSVSTLEAPSFSKNIQGEQRFNQSTSMPPGYSGSTSEAPRFSGSTSVAPRYTDGTPVVPGYSYSPSEKPRYSELLSTAPQKSESTSIVQNIGTSAIAPRFSENTFLSTSYDSTSTAPRYSEGTLMAPPTMLSRTSESAPFTSHTIVLRPSDGTVLAQRTTEFLLGENTVGSLMMSYQR
eukprot:XP_011670321.1 PREDICTED: uncharacterized protein LOC105441150 [Strongylocentrotus purpuratus]